MKKQLCVAAVSLLLTAPFLGAQPMQHGQGGHAGAAASGGMDFMAEMKTSHEKMMSMPMTGNTDVDFAMMMRMHHMSGVRMAEIELRNGKQAETRAMAKKIITDQKKEIAKLEAFLAKQGHPVDKMK